MKEFKVLLGATKDGEIVFGEFGIRTFNGLSDFSASFDTVRPFTEEELESPESYYENLLESCYDEASKYEMCERFDCKPSELAEILMGEEGSEPQNLRDCSLYTNIIEVNGTDYYFESGCCGQHDTRKEMEHYVNKEAYDVLHELWDSFHLKNVENRSDFKEKYNRLLDLLKDQTEQSEEQWIADYIKKYVE